MTKKDRLPESVFPITTSVGSNKVGTGFLVGYVDDYSLIITCHHVVSEIGEDNLQIRGNPCQLVSSFGNDDLDLAVLKVILPDAGDKVSTPLSIGVNSKEDANFETFGFDLEQRGRKLKGSFGATTTAENPTDDPTPDKIYGRDYYIENKEKPNEIVKNGYSGAPMLCDNKVVGVITHRAGKEKGIAVDISNIFHVYPELKRFIQLDNDMSESPKDEVVQQESKVSPDDIVENYVYRGRFQPFCKDHYEAIQGFWSRYVDGVESKVVANLYLWVVKSLYTTAHNMTKGSIENEDENFRHRSFFNPLSYMDCAKTIRIDLFHFIDEDMKKLEKASGIWKKYSAFKRWAAVHLHIISIPFSIKELTTYWDQEEGLIYGDPRPPADGSGAFSTIFRQLYPSTKYTFDKITDSVESNKQEDFRQHAQDSMAEIAHTLATRFKDTSSFERPTMYLPIFDRQDATKDKHYLDDVGWPSDKCILPWVNRAADGVESRYYQVSKGVLAGELCAQNAFIYLAFLMYLDSQVSNQNIVSKFRIENLDEEISNVSSFLVKRSTTETVRKFKNNVKININEFYEGTTGIDGTRARAWSEARENMQSAMDYIKRPSRMESNWDDVFNLEVIS